MKPPGKKLLIIQTSLNFVFILNKESLGPYYTTLKRLRYNFDGMSRFLIKNWTGGTFSSKLMAAKRGENGGQRVKSKNQEPDFTSHTGKKTSKKQIFRLTFG